MTAKSVVRSILLQMCVARFMRRAAIAMAAALAIGIPPGIAAADLSQSVKFRIEPQSLPSALLEYSEQSGIQVTSASELVNGKTSEGAVGSLSARDALERILRGTALAYDVINASTVVIVPVPARERDAAAVEEVVVTGTHIRGNTAAGAALTSVGREDFERGGFLDIGEALRSLPVNFGGGFNPETGQAAANVGQVGSNFTHASSANLHGLGNGATLTLLNGKRLPPVGSGVAVDLSTIPLVAIERVDVLADGASAIYGTDAVAGVVNVITRRTYDGTQVRASYGGAEGGLATYTGSLLSGGRIGDFNGVAGVEYFSQEKLTGDERDRSRLVPRPFWIFGDSERKSAFASGQYDLNSRVQLYADGVYSTRTGHSMVNTIGAIADSPYEDSQYSASTGVSVRLAETWSLDVFGTFSENTASTHLTNTTTAGVVTRSASDRRNELRNAEVRGSGRLLSLPGGDVSAALGTAYREEEISSRTHPTTFVGSRSISSAYAELNVPLVGAGNRLPFVNAFSLNLAGRRDDYSDAGSVAVPKVGASWSITADLAVRAAFSRSFRAPSLFESGVSYYGYILDAKDNSPSGVTRILYLTGTGASLKPETSKNIDFGVSYDPRWLSGLSLSANLYRIDYTNRIANADPTFAYAFDVSQVPAALIDYSPELSQLQSILAGTNATYPLYGATADPTLISALVDVRTGNVAATRTKGVDAFVGYRTDTALGLFDSSANMTYIDRLEDQLVPGGAFVQRFGTIFYPTRFNSRLGTRWTRGSWNASMFWSYVSSYVDDRIPSATHPVDSWSTFDASVGYGFGAGAGGAGKGTRVVLSVTNALDKDPPRVAPQTILGNVVRPTEYDPTNASIVGRFVRMELVKQW